MMKQSLLSKVSLAALFCGTLFFTSCHSSYRLIGVEGGRIEMTSAYEVHPDSAAVSILAPYKAKIDSMMKPVVGESEMDMEAARPESLLSNLVAGVLQDASTTAIGKSADVGIVNVGGLRSDLFKGNITFENIYEILPFENTLCILTMSGKDMKQLFKEIAKVGGEGISGARMVITKEGELLESTINGEVIDDHKFYKVATLDYLSEGNDGMSSFTKAVTKECPGITIREVFLEYVRNQTKAGKKVTSSLDGRITIK